MARLFTQKTRLAVLAQENKSSSIVNMSSHNEANNNTITFNGKLTASGGGLNDEFIQAGHISQSSVDIDSVQGEEPEESHESHSSDNTTHHYEVNNNTVNHHGSLTGGFHTGIIQSGNTSRSNSNINTECLEGGKPDESHSRNNTADHYEANNTTITVHGRQTGGSIIGVNQGETITGSTVNIDSVQGEEEKDSDSSANSQNHYEANNTTVTVHGKQTGGTILGVHQGGALVGHQVTVEDAESA